ncbi:3-oxoacyl-[acyl-carrier protein] reductase [Cronobacter turicensis 564]|nr:3-oxoacyl-[acyl-carrier protein] reductase [Cronobacter turicensis 564]
MNARFTNKVVIVTGGTSGIGLATAKAFADEGAHVFITGRRQAALESALQQLGDNVTGVRGDMSQLADIDRLYEAVQQRHSHIDVIVANAGGGELAPLGAISEAHYHETFDTNVKGVLFTVQKALPLLRDGARVGADGVYRRFQRHARVQRLQREQSRGTQFCAQLDTRFERPPYSRERHQPGAG